jgi:phosphoenolpyruvate carboxylase
LFIMPYLFYNECCVSITTSHEFCQKNTFGWACCSSARINEKDWPYHAHVCQIIHRKLLICINTLQATRRSILHKQKELDVLLEEQDNYHDTLTPLMKERLFMRMQQVLCISDTVGMYFSPLCKYLPDIGLQTETFLWKRHGVCTRHLMYSPAQTLLANWKTNPVRSLKPTPEDEARYGISVIEESLWQAVPEASIYAGCLHASPMAL